MNIEELFDFYFNETEGYWSVTGYYGRDEEVVLPIFMQFLFIILNSH